uniref:Uncharacterized protein n=1 Tax=uncultured marine virus TaxID=186617 RepID=A0A0F7L1P2_9VIRU|nr:hypothetical protein [uncultured marine virus]
MLPHTSASAKLRSVSTVGAFCRMRASTLDGQWAWSDTTPPLVPKVAALVVLRNTRTGRVSGPQS